MRKIWVILIIAVLVLATIFILFEIWDRADGENNEAIPYSQFLQIVKPSVLEYCNSLENTAGLDSNKDKKCPTCFPIISANYDNYYESNPQDYTLIKRGGNYFFSLDIRTVYHWRNDMPGSASIYFIVEGNGSILKETIPELDCI